MKFLFILASSCFSNLAMACLLDISGIYKVTESSLVKYEQRGCEQVTRTYGKLKENESINWSSPEVFVFSDHSSQKETAYVYADHITFTASNDSPILTPDHGTCAQNSYELSMDLAHRLYVSYFVKNCEDGSFSDGYVGIFTKLLPRHN